MNFHGLATVFFINIHFANLYGGKREHTLLIKKKDKEKGAFIFPSLAYFIVIHHQILATKTAVPIVFLALCQNLSNSQGRPNYLGGLKQNFKMRP